MSDYYQLRLYTPSGRFIRLIENYSRLTIGRKQNAAGSLTFSVPFSLPIEPRSIIIVERSVNGGAMSMFGETLFLVERLNYSSDGLTYTAYDANYLWEWRIVAYNSGTPYADKELPADDYIKALARENLGLKAIDQRRAWPIAIEPDLSLAPVIKQQSARDKLSNVFQTLTQASYEKGTPLYFDLIADYDLNLTLRTYAKQRGIDRSSLILTLDHLLEAELEIDDSAAPTVIYSGGKGRGENRQVELVYRDEALQGKYAWREAWAADKDLSETQALIDEGYAQLKAKQRTVTLTAKVINAPHMALGKHYNFGDIVTAQVYGYNIPCAVDEFEITIEGGKLESTISLMSL